MKPEKKNIVEIQSITLKYITENIKKILSFGGREHWSTESV